MYDGSYLSSTLCRYTGCPREVEQIVHLAGSCKWGHPGRPQAEHQMS